MEIALGIILLVSIGFLVWYCVKGYNIMVGFFIMAVLWTTIALIGNATIPMGEYVNVRFDGAQGLEAFLTAIRITFQDGPQNFGASILTNIFFGAFFGRVLLETNIASTLIKQAVELGGDRPKFTLGLLSVLTSILFVNMTGIGPVMAVAVIVLPILLTIGIPANVALFSFMGSITAGVLVNPINFAQYHAIILAAVTGAFADSSVIDYVANFTYSEYAFFGWIGLAITLVAVILVSNIVMGFKKKTYSWAVDTSATNGVKKDAPWYSWIAILIPVALITTFNVLTFTDAEGVVRNYTQFSTIFAFIVASIYATATTGALKGGYKVVTAKFSKFFADGALDAAPMIGFLLSLSMFSNAAGLNVPYLRAIVGELIPNNAILLGLMFAFLSIGSFFRGPINLVGSGAAFASIVFIGIGAESVQTFSILFIYILFSITTIVPQHLDITQSWVAWGLGYTNVNPKDFMKMSIPTGYAVSIILCLLALVMYAI